MVTTVQLNENVKVALDRLKSSRDTYEQVIVNLIKVAEECRRKEEALLIEGCKVMADDMIKLNEEWGVVSSDLDWEW